MRYKITNLMTGRVVLPPPFGGSLGPRESVTISAAAALVEQFDPAYGRKSKINEMIRARIIHIEADDDREKDVNVEVSAITLYSTWGQYQSVASATERNSLVPEKRTEGMLVRTNDDGRIWVLGPDLITWTEVPLGPAGDSLWSTSGTETVLVTPTDTVTLNSALDVVDATPTGESSHIDPYQIRWSDGSTLAAMDVSGLSISDSVGDASARLAVSTGTPTLTAQTVVGPTPLPLNLSIGELQVNGAAGTSGHVLQSNGVGSAPSWSAVPASADTVASAATVTLPQATLITVSGNTQINTFSTVGWSAGAHVTLKFSGALLVKASAAKLAGELNNVDFQAAADSILGLVFDGTNWHETFRKVA